MRKFLLFIAAGVLIASCQKKKNDDPVAIEQSLEVTNKPLLTKVITGEISYRQRIALETPYRVEIEMYELDNAHKQSVGDIQSFIVDHQVPVNFIFHYNDDLITPEEKEYGLEARIYRIGDNTLGWRNDILVNPFTIPFDYLKIIVNQIL